MIYFVVTIVQILICFLLQSSVFPWFRLADVVPDILMILVVFNAYTFGILPGMFTGLACGLILDSTIGNLIGLYAAIIYKNSYGIYFHRSRPFDTLSILRATPASRVESRSHPSRCDGGSSDSTRVGALAP